MDDGQKKIVSLTERREQIARAKNWEAATERESRLELIRYLADGDLETFLDGLVNSTGSTCNYIKWEQEDGKILLNGEVEARWHEFHQAVIDLYREYSDLPFPEFKEEEG